MISFWLKQMRQIFMPFLGARKWTICLIHVVLFRQLYVPHMQHFVYF